MFGIRQHARLVFAEDPIAVARHNFVDCVSKASRQHPADSRQTPNATQLHQHVQDRIRPRQQSLSGLPVVLHHIDGIEIMRINTVTCHQAVRKFAL